VPEAACRLELVPLRDHQAPLLPPVHVRALASIPSNGIRAGGVRSSRKKADVLQISDLTSLKSGWINQNLHPLFSQA
jgi:hypothetical protein